MIARLAIEKIDLKNLTESDRTCQSSKSTARNRHLKPHFHLFSIIFAISTLLFAACGEDDKSDPPAQSHQIESEGIHIESAWARPADEGRISAAYFLISNFSDKADTLLSVHSDVAQLAEIHESYEQEEGMMGMREVPELEIPVQSTVRLEQGGLHIMLIRLTRRLEAGDTFELTLHFANHGKQTIEIVARL